MIFYRYSALALKRCLEMEQQAIKLVQIVTASGNNGFQRAGPRKTPDQSDPDD